MTSRRTARLVREVEARGLLLAHDRDLPSVTALVAGAPVAGSWWSHPRAREIYAALSRLEETPSLLLVKLVNGKETFVHRALWPALFTVARAREAWQMQGLARSARTLLDRVDARGAVRLDRLAEGDAERKALRAAARSLVARLLVHARQVHTESGAHQKELVAWEPLARELGVGRSWEDLDAAREALASKTEGRLPWERAPRLNTRGRSRATAAGARRARRRKA